MFMRHTLLTALVILIFSQPVLADNFLSLIDEDLNRLPQAHTDEYVQPGSGDISALTDALDAIAGGDLQTARDLVDPLDYDVTEITHTLRSGREVTLIVLRENDPVSRGWGTVAYNPQATAEATVQVPHPWFEYRTPELGARLMLESGARWFVMAGAHRCADATPEVCPDRDNDSDMSYNEGSLFHLVHTYSDADIHFQIHGFNGSRDHYDGYPDAVISNGTESPGPALTELAGRLENAGISTGVFSEDTSNSLSLLGATRNVQGIHSQSRDGEFIHVEFDLWVRESDTMMGQSVMAMAGMVNAMSGTYTIGEPGSDDGDDPDFATLDEAFDDLMSRGSDGDVTFLITSDIDQQENAALAYDPGPEHTVTIRPAPGTTPEVLFASNIENEFNRGALIIGLNDSDAPSDGLLPTRNIIIDGSNTPGESTRDLTLRVSGDAGVENNMFRVLGDVQDVTFRNTNMIIDEEVAGNSWDALEIVSRGAGDEDDIDRVPQNILIENNYIENLSHSSARSVRVTSIVNSPQTGVTVTVRDNDLLAYRYGVRIMDDGGDTEITGNTIRIQQSSGNGSLGIWIQDTVDDDNNILISNNRIVDSVSDANLTGILGSTRAVYRITGNLIHNLQAGSSARGIRVSTGGGDYTIDGNTILGLHGDEGVDMIGLANNLEMDHTVRIHNNMISGFSSGSTTSRFLHGIVLRSPSGAIADVEIHHNTIVMNPLEIASGTGWDYRGLTVFSSNSINLDMQNNIFVNADDNDSDVESYIYSQAGSAAANLTADFNLYHVPNASSDNLTFLSRHTADLQAVNVNEHRNHTGFDDYATGADPGLIADDSLFVDSSVWAAFGRGVPVEGISEDILGNQRSVSIEEGPVALGAHEYQAEGWAQTEGEAAADGRRFRGSDGSSVVLALPDETEVPEDMTAVYRPGTRASSLTDESRGQSLFRVWNLDLGDEVGHHLDTYLYFNTATEHSGLDLDELTVYRFDEENEVWEGYPTEPDVENGVLQFTASQSGKYIASVADPVATGAGDRVAEVAETAELHANYPNPFNPETTVSFTLPEPAEVSLVIIDALGRTVSRPLSGESRPAGTHDVTVDMSRFASGVYIYRLEAGGHTFSRTMTLIK